MVSPPQVFNSDIGDKALDSFPQLLEGIVQPRLVTLSPNQRIYRVGSRRNTWTGENVPKEEWAVSPWWFSEHDHVVVADVFARHRKLLEKAVGPRGRARPFFRSALALLDDYSDASVMVVATVQQPINAFVGQGSLQVSDAGRTYLRRGLPVHRKPRSLPGWPSITQIYIPNPDKLFGEALRIYGYIRMRNIY